MDNAGDEPSEAADNAGQAADSAGQGADDAPPADGDSTPVALARAYYRALDEGDYDRLASILAPGFVHERPDRTFEGRERFVRFMREERPQTDTSHPIDGIYVPFDGSPLDGTEAADGDVVVRGRLLAGDGSEIARFVDVFDLDEGELRRLRTYTA